MFKKLRKPFRPFTRSVILVMLWTNRRDVVRWMNFAKRVATPATRPAPDDLKLEAKVRASLSSDPLLRADPSIRDVRVRDGVVMLETPAEWHNRALAISRLSQVTGVESVHTTHDVNEPNWLDVDSADIRVATV